MAVRRVRRILRRIDPWTVLKVSLVFNAIAALIFVLGTWVIWSMALRRGIPERVIDIFESLTLSLTIEGELYFRIVVLLAIIGAILATAFMTLGAVLYNLIADLVGGIEIAVLEETYRPTSTRTTMVPTSETAPAAMPAAESAPGEDAGVADPGTAEPVPIPSDLPPVADPALVPAAASRTAAPVAAQTAAGRDTETVLIEDNDMSRLGAG
jgi:hypothetical protein